MRNLIVVSLLLAAGIGCARRQWEPLRDMYRSATAVVPLDGCTDETVYRLPAFRASDTLTLEGTRRRHIGAVRPLQAWTARQVPGGWSTGPTWGPSTASVIYMKDPAQKHAALAALAALDSLNPRQWGSIPPPRRDTVEVVPVRWDYAELYDWMWYAFLHWPPGAQLTMWAIDDRRGRLLLGIEDVMGLPDLMRHLQDLNVPCDLFYVEVSGPIMLLPAPSFPRR